MPHLPLSQSLAQMLEGESASSGLTLNLLLERTAGRGIYLVMILLCLPFVIPVSIPGMSTVMGSIIILLSLGLAIRTRPRLPKGIGERKLQPGLKQKLLGGSVKLLRFIERWIRPRRTEWMSWRLAHGANALIVTFMALLLALPLPAPPFFFCNSLPSYAIIILSASMMEEDGLLIWFGYAMVAANLVYFGLMGGFVWIYLHRYHDVIAKFFAAWL